MSTRRALMRQNAFRGLCLARPYLPAGLMGAIAVVAVAGLTVGLPRWATDWFARPQFMRGCILGSSLDDETLRLCTAAYERYRAVVANGYRPLGDRP